MNRRAGHVWLVDGSGGWMEKKWLLWIGFVPFLIRGGSCLACLPCVCFSDAVPAIPAGSSRSANTTSLEISSCVVYLSERI